ncbi:Uncharacterised protein [Janthinobacterium lividum]|nr:hypothetical protein JANLI_34580 [Janthinobacterium lividum]STQ97372.1 Uncharacterised protein [Janthinobacterium lividum]
MMVIMRNLRNNSTAQPSAPNRKEATHERIVEVAIADHFLTSPLRGWYRFHPDRAFDTRSPNTSTAKPEIISR